MQAIRSGASVALCTKAAGRWSAPIEASTAVLELTASEQPQTLDFVAHVLCNSTMSFAVERLAQTFDVPSERVGRVIGKACKDLDRLENHRGAWQDPAEIVHKPNLAVLLYVCRARLSRVSQLARQRRLERILRRVEAAYELAKSRAWIEAFIGPLPVKRKEAQGADR